MAQPSVPDGVDDRRTGRGVSPLGLRTRHRVGAVLAALAAFMSVGLVAGPLRAAATGTPCALPRTDAHHSLGLDTWNASYPRPEGTLDAALLFLSFPDAEPMATPRELTKDHFPATSDFFERASYGKFRLRPHTVDRWIEMPSPAGSYRIQRDWDSGHRTSYLRDAVAAADPYVDFGAYDVVYVVADPDAPGVNSDATKVVNLEDPIKADGTDIKRLVTVFEQSPPDRNVLAHETGHLFDLPDLYQRPTDGGADWDTRVGDWDLMGSQFGLAPEPFAWHKWKLGWLDRAQVTCLSNTDSTPAQSVHTLRPLAAPPRGGAGAGGAGASGGTAGTAGDKRLLVLRTGENEALAIEARDREGNDETLCRQGVLLYRVRSDTASTEGPVEVVDAHPGTSGCLDRSVHAELADAPLGVGESYADPRNALRVEVLGRTAEGDWNIEITRGTTEPG
ncbi:M6 family metalloprotease domain-containing protein [Streptomyces cacaoi]|uniref:M6 family metalloprotease domain-containing protein n=1 Tax=Streptomyces cacaoi TaxID=1898 RepID=UPI0035307CFE